MTDILKVEVNGAVAVLTMNRPDKRNAMCDALLDQIDAFFSRTPEGVKVAVLTGTAGHFCSGLDLSEHVARDAEGTMRHSRGWHQVMEKIQFGGLPVVSALFGATIGGGLELATSTHVRIAESSSIFQLPEGRRGIFVGGGASVRVGRILGADRMIEMMLTGRKYNAEEALALGLAHYAVGEGEALPLAMDLARKIADNAPLSNYIMIQALARIEDMSKADGLFTESLCAALTQNSPDAVEGLAAFLEKRAPNFKKPNHMPSNPKDVCAESLISAGRLSGLVGYHMRRASMHVQADLAKTLAPFELRMITFSALSVISENAGLRQYQLADALAIERANLVVIIDELETRGLIRRERVPTDRRAYALRITRKGAALFKRVVKVVEAHEVRFFGDLSEESRGLLLEALCAVEAKGEKRK